MPILREPHHVRVIRHIYHIEYHTITIIPAIIFEHRHQVSAPTGRHSERGHGQQCRSRGASIDAARGMPRQLTPMDAVTGLPHNAYPYFAFDYNTTLPLYLQESGRPKCTTDAAASIFIGRRTPQGAATDMMSIVKNDAAH